VRQIGTHGSNVKRISAASKCTVDVPSVDDVLRSGGTKGTKVVLLVGEHLEDVQIAKEMIVTKLERKQACVCCCFVALLACGVRSQPLRLCRVTWTPIQLHSSPARGRAPKRVRKDEPRTRGRSRGQRSRSRSRTRVARSTGGGAGAGAGAGARAGTRASGSRSPGGVRTTDVVDLTDEPDDGDAEMGTGGVMTPHLFSLDSLIDDACGQLEQGTLNGYDLMLKLVGDDCRGLKPLICSASVLRLI